MQPELLAGRADEIVRALSLRGERPRHGVVVAQVAVVSDEVPVLQDHRPQHHCQHTLVQTLPKNSADAHWFRLCRKLAQTV